jgi:hypothetical protein
MAAPAGAWGNSALSDSQEPGSVLVFPKFIRGTVLTPDQGTLPVTQFEISVVCPKGFDCSTLPAGFQLNLRAHWVCPQDTTTGTCQETDFNLSTTINGTIFFNPENISPTNVDFVPRPPCDRGYLIVSVIDGDGNPISSDSLLGDAVIRGSNLSARSYNGIPIQAVAAPGNRIGVAGGPLSFDGSMYQQVTGKVFGSVAYESFIDSPNIATDLTLITLDVASNRPNNPTFLDLNFYNEREQLISTSTNFTCWEEVRLTDIHPGLTTDFGTKGLVVSDAATQNGVPVTTIGFVETFERFSLPISASATETFTALVGEAGTTVTPQCTLSTSPGSSGSCSASCTFSTRCILRDPTNPKLCAIEVPIVTCTTNLGITTPLNSIREYMRPVLNDSTPVSTTFFPF